MDTDGVRCRVAQTRPQNKVHDTEPRRERVAASVGWLTVSYIPGSRDPVVGSTANLLLHALAKSKRCTRRASGVRPLLHAAHAATVSVPPKKGCVPYERRIKLSRRCHGRSSHAFAQRRCRLVDRVCSFRLVRFISLLCDTLRRQIGAFFDSSAPLSLALQSECCLLSARQPPLSASLHPARRHLIRYPPDQLEKTISACQSCREFVGGLIHGPDVRVEDAAAVRALHPARCGHRAMIKPIWGKKAQAHPKRK